MPPRYSIENGSTNTLNPSCDDRVVVRRLVFDQQAVLETRTAAGLNRNAQSADVRRDIFSDHELLDLDGRGGCHRQLDFGLIDRAHKQFLLSATLASGSSNHGVIIHQWKSKLNKNGCFGGPA